MSLSPSIHDQLPRPQRRAPLAGTLGLLVPGLGLLVRGDWTSGLLALGAVVHCIVLGTCSLAALASRGNVAEDATTAAILALQAGFIDPQAVLMWGLALAIHLGTAWQAFAPATSMASPESISAPTGTPKGEHAPAAQH